MVVVTEAFPGPHGVTLLFTTSPAEIATVDFGPTPAYGFTVTEPYAVVDHRIAIEDHSISGTIYYSVTTSAGPPPTFLVLRDGSMITNRRQALLIT